jgi:hypothetical protein
MSDTSDFAALLKAGPGDGLEIGGERFPIASVGESATYDGFATREFTLGGEKDFYLVVEGPLAGGDPGSCRAVLTHELNPQEVRFRMPTGRSQLVTYALGTSDNPPREIEFHGCSYAFGRRVDARYTSRDRECDRTTWDFERGGRNLAVERWPGGEMAVYEGRQFPFSQIRVLEGYGPPPRQLDKDALRGLIIGAILMIVGLVMLLI